MRELATPLFPVEVMTAIAGIVLCVVLAFVWL